MQRLAKRRDLHLAAEEQAIVNHLEAGLGLLVKVAGTSFPCEATGEDRQAIIARLSEQESEKIKVALEKQTANPHDADAICVRLSSGEDIGFIPRKGSVSLELIRGQRRYWQTYSSPRLNTLFRSFDLDAEIVEITGGSGRYANYGLVLYIRKNTTL